MGIEIKINIDLSPRQKKIMRAAVVGGVVIGALGIGIAIAAPPHAFMTSETLTATNLNSLNVATNGSVSYSVGATTYCGTGPTSTTGAISYNGAIGYPGAKAMCQASSGCSNSPTAHMCSAEEMVRSSQLGISLPAGFGWYASGVGVSIGSNEDVDCAGWNSAATATYGPGYIGSPLESGWTTCNTMNPVLCCD
jgi:hypothetical protein